VSTNLHTSNERCQFKLYIGYWTSNNNKWAKCYQTPPDDTCANDVTDNDVIDSWINMHTLLASRLMWWRWCEWGFRHYNRLRCQRPCRECHRLGHWWHWLHRLKCYDSPHTQRRTAPPRVDPSPPCCSSRSPNHISHISLTHSYLTAHITHD